MLNRYTKVKIQCPRRPRSKVAGSSPAQHRTIPHSRTLPPPIPRALMPRPSIRYMDTELGDSGPTQAGPPVPGSSLPDGRPTFPTSQGSYGDLDRTRHKHPVENEGRPSRPKESQPWRRETKEKELTLPSVFSTLSNTLSINATDNQLARISAIWTWSGSRRSKSPSAIKRSRTQSRLGNLSTR